MNYEDLVLPAPPPYLADARPGGCAISNCKGAATHDGYCGDCYDYITAMDAKQVAERARAMNERSYGPWALAIMREFEWVWTLLLAGGCLAFLLFQERAFVWDCVRSIKHALLWGR